MKNKKRIQKILLILIVVVAVIMVIVLVFGSLKTKQFNEYKDMLENATCKMAFDRNFTETICEGYDGFCNVSLSELVNKEYVDNKLKNPLTGEYVKDTKEFVAITWNDDKMVCTYNEG